MSERYVYVQRGAPGTWLVKLYGKHGKMEVQSYAQIPPRRPNWEIALYSQKGTGEPVLYAVTSLNGDIFSPKAWLSYRAPIFTDRRRADMFLKRINAWLDGERKSVGFGGTSRSVRSAQVYSTAITEYRMVKIIKHPLGDKSYNTGPEYNQVYNRETGKYNTPPKYQTVYARYTPSTGKVERFGWRQPDVPLRGLRQGQKVGSFEVGVDSDIEVYAVADPNTKRPISASGVGRPVWKGRRSPSMRMRGDWYLFPTHFEAAAAIMNLVNTTKYYDDTAWDVIKLGLTDTLENDLNRRYSQDDPELGESLRQFLKRLVSP